MNYEKLESMKFGDIFISNESFFHGKDLKYFILENEYRNNEMILYSLDGKSKQRRFLIMYSQIKEGLIDIKDNIISLSKQDLLEFIKKL